MPDMQVCFDGLTAAEAMTRELQMLSVEETPTLAGLKALADKYCKAHVSSPTSQGRGKRNSHKVTESEFRSYQQQPRPRTG